MILDLSSGRRNIWHNKEAKGVVYLDIREGVKPDCVADSTQLPFADSQFSLIVFDPPHTTFGPNSQMAQRYGSFKAHEIRAIVSATAAEAARVATGDALMSFKWSNHGHCSFEKILGLMASWWEPLFGHTVSIRTKHASTTQWIVLRRNHNL